MNKLLKALSEYCEINYLKVNLAKSNVMIFTRSGNAALNTPLYYNGEVIQYCKTYTYLGVLISASNRFLQMSRASIKKAKLACGSVLSILSESKCNLFESCSRLYNSLAQS